MIRLLFLSDHLGYPDGVTTGATTYFMNVLPALQRAGVVFWTCFLRDRHPAAEKLEAQGVRPVFLNRGKWDPKALQDLVRLIRKHDINLVHAAGMKGILLGRAAARICRCKFIMHLHDISVPGFFLRSLHRGMARWTDQCLVISNAVGQLARKQFGLPVDRVAVLYNGIDLSKISSPSSDARTKVRAEFNLHGDAPVLGIIGRLSPEKGQAFFLPSLPKLLATHPGVKLLIVGEGPTRKECEQIITKYNMASAVRLAGHRADMPDILAAIDVLVIPSLMEGLSFCAIEAMAAGRPVAAFNVGGLPELIVHEETGLLAPQGDAQALLHQVRRLLDDRNLSTMLVANARRFVQEFSVAEHVQKLIRLYEQTLHARDNRR